MKKRVFTLCLVIALIAVAIGVFFAIDMYRMDKNLPVIFSTWGYDYAPPEEHIIKCPAEAPRAFLATVLEEDTTYMLVEPDKDSDEYKCADKIRIEYGTDHIDYLYGVGRRVVIYYSGMILESYPAMIITDDISTEGFKDFEISVVKSEDNNERFVLKDGRDISLYYHGLNEVNIEINGDTMPLETAIKKNYVTLDGIVAKAAGRAQEGSVVELIFEDGGSALYSFEDFSILKKHTRDGNRDVHIKSTSYKF